MKQSLFICILLIVFSCTSSVKVYHQSDDNIDLKVRKFKDVTLEVSLKPFKVNNRDSIDKVCRDIYLQWMPLLRYADTVSVMLWTADGSEILNYKGEKSQKMEWGKYIGNPNANHEVNSGPEDLTLHERAYEYMQNPPEYTYDDLKYIVSALKKTGKLLLDKPVRIGETFDPGPEFAKSEFKYKKHPEICISKTMGENSFICCYAILKADKEHYAGFPSGIPQGTTFGTFLGKQSQHFLSDMGFDFLWFSNGLGFGLEPWSATGALYDGKSFHPEKLASVQKKVIDFWKDFRKECPTYRIETRGTNISVGADLAKDGVDLRSIYNGEFNILPPPNSPWAALDGNFGLELAGYMSRISELPDENYLFRYYTHDPWWANSPWLDRYGREPHDIYLPMSVTRINENGQVSLPSHLTFLTIDNSYGNMPDQVPDEVIPHILQARRLSPDEPGVVTWVYPFDEYHDWAYKQPERIDEIYYGDWFVQQAINDGFPLNTVVSSRIFTNLMKKNSPIFKGTILLSIVPDAGSDMENQLMRFVENGGKLLVYGPVGHASKRFLQFLNIKLVEPLSGAMNLKLTVATDNVQKAGSLVLKHDASMSAGGIETVVDINQDMATSVLAQAALNNQQRDIVVQHQKKEWNGGSVIYLRATNSASYHGGQLLTPDNPTQWFNGSSLLRYALCNMGYDIYYRKTEADIKNPVNCIFKNDNAFYFAGYIPNQTVEEQLYFPQGAPIFTGYETELREGKAIYHLPKAYVGECRVFVVQKEGIISCYEIPPVEYQINRKIGISGLKNATIRLYPGKSNKVKVLNNASYPYSKPAMPLVKGNQFPGNYYEFKNMSGTVELVW